MKPKTHLKPIIIWSILFILLVFLLNSQQLFDPIVYGSYTKLRFPYWSYTGSLDKQLFVPTFSQLYTLLKSEARQEKGVGIMGYKYLNFSFTKARITLQKTYSGDDSVGPSQYYFIAEKKPAGWTITEYAIKSHCLRGQTASGSCL